MGWREGAIERSWRQRRALDLDHRHVDVAGLVLTLAPEALAVAIERDRKPGRFGQVVGVGVQLDLDTVGEMQARLVAQHVPAGHQEQPLAARKEKAAGVGQRPPLLESTDARGGEKNGVDHRMGGTWVV
jgi:hypothetical protein